MKNHLISFATGVIHALIFATVLFTLTYTAIDIQHANNCVQVEASQ